MARTASTRHHISRNTTAVARTASRSASTGAFVAHATLKKAGGSLIMTVPASARDALHLSEGQEMDIAVADGRMTVTATHSRPRYSLKELLAQCDPDTPISDETRAWSEAPPQGREVW